MKTLTPAMIGYLQSDTQTFNTCLSIIRTDAVAFYFTDCDQPIVFGGHTYSPIDAYSPSNLQSSADLSVDHIEIMSYLDSAGMTEADVSAGKWDDAVASIFMVNRNDLTAGAYRMRDGPLGQTTIISPAQFQQEVRGLNQYLQKQIGDVITPACRWDLGSTSLTGPPGNRGLCNVNLVPLTVTGVAVTSVVSNQSFTASSLAQAADYFGNGKLIWTSGLNIGRRMDVQAHGGGGVLVLQLPMLNNVQIGDLFTIVPGCRKRFTQDCVTKFSNGINHGGFNRLPGLDKMLRPGGV